MVKAVNIDESPNTLGNPPKKSSADGLSIANPDADVEFVINTENDNLQLDINIEEIVNNVSVEPQYQIKKLQRKKIDELRKLASELEISINKVVNGKLKNKTKKELCNEIIENQST